MRIVLSAEPARHLLAQAFRRAMRELSLGGTLLGGEAEPLAGHPGGRWQAGVDATRRAKAAATVAARPTRAPVASTAASLRPEGSLITPHLSPSQQEDAYRDAHAKRFAVAAEQQVIMDRAANRAAALADGGQDSRPPEIPIASANA